MLLGAGSSLPEIPGVPELTKRLLAWDLFKEPPRRPRQLLTMSPFERKEGRDRRANLFQAVADRMAGSMKRPPNFEDVIGFCEELASLLPGPGGASQPILSFLELRRDVRHYAQNFAPPGLGVGGTATALNVVLETACAQILSWVAEACETLDDAPATATAMGLRALADAFFLRLFSLNYDDVPVHANVPFYTGFVDGQGGEPQRFAPAYPWPRDNHTWVQLHGSVLFRMIPGGEPVRFQKRTDAAAYAPLAPSLGRAQDGSLIVTGPMITGTRKAEKLLERPYGTYLHVFRDELLRCRRWLVVGYGFGDVHINHMMSQARRLHRNDGHPVRAVVVDYSPELQDQGTMHLEPRRDLGGRLEKKEGAVFPDAIAGLLARPEYVRARKGHLLRVSDDLLISLDGVAEAFGPQMGEIVAFLSS